MKLILEVSMFKTLCYVMLFCLLCVQGVGEVWGVPCGEECTEDHAAGDIVMGTTNPICCVPIAGGGGTQQEGKVCTEAQLGANPPAFQCYKDGVYYETGKGCTLIGQGEVKKCVDGLAVTQYVQFWCDWTTNDCGHGDPDPNKRTVFRADRCLDC
jgi:hypothetical protein